MIVESWRTMANVRMLLVVLAFAPGAAFAQGMNLVPGARRPMSMAFEPARQNGLLQSETSCVGNAVQVPWTISGTPTCVTNNSAAPSGVQTADSWTTSTSAQYIYQTGSTPSTKRFTASVYVKRSTAGVTSLYGQCTAGAATACACYRSDRGACTATLASPNCITKSSVPAGVWVRIAALTECSAPLTNPILVFAPGETSVSIATAAYWGAQIEPGWVALTYAPTTTAVVLKSARPWR